MLDKTMTYMKKLFPIFYFGMFHETLSRKNVVEEVFFVCCGAIVNWDRPAINLQTLDIGRAHTDLQELLSVVTVVLIPLCITQVTQSTVPRTAAMMEQRNDVIPRQP